MYHLMHCIPHPRTHAFNGFTEVIDSVFWGMQALGHKVTRSKNTFNPQAINIVFGAHVLPISFMEGMPRDTVIYNFEQMRGLKAEEIRPEAHYIAKNFTIWEYSKANFDTWGMLGANPLWFPVSYSPNICRIPKFQVQDIDVLMYGMSGEKRAIAFHQLSEAGFAVVFVSGLYGEARDTLIARSKLILNVNIYDRSKIFEIVRASYLLANKKAIITIDDPDTYFEEDILGAIKRVHLNDLVKTVESLLNDTSDRESLETAGFEIFEKRDIRITLKRVLTLP